MSIFFHPTASETVISISKAGCNMKVKNMSPVTNEHARIPLTSPIYYTKTLAINKKDTVIKTPVTARGNDVFVRGFSFSPACYPFCPIAPSCPI
jgi:hypothetical protein